MPYPDGSPVKIGDTVRLWADRYGTVVCSFDSDEFSDEFPRDEWQSLATGVLIKTDDMGVFHYTEPDEDLELIERR